MTLTHAQLLLFLAGAVLIVLLGAKRVCDRRLSRTLAAGLAEIERELAAARQAGVVAMDALGRSANR